MIHSSSDLLSVKLCSCLGYAMLPHIPGYQGMHGLIIITVYRWETPMPGRLTIWWFSINTTWDVWTSGKLINPSAVNGGCILLNRTATKHRSWEMSEKVRTSCIMHHTGMNTIELFSWKMNFEPVSVSWLFTHTNNDKMTLLPNFSVAMQWWYI